MKSVIRDMMLRLCFSIIWCTFAALPATCQEKPALPPGPLIQKVPDFVDLTITYKYYDDDKFDRGSALQLTPKNGTSQVSAKLRQERIIKTKNASYFLWIDEAGVREECWLIQGMQWITPKGEHKRQIAIDKNDSFFKSDIQAVNFQGLEWISEANFTGIKLFMNKECLAFQKVDHNNGLILAYIDFDTRLPVFLQTGKTVRVYSFGSPPPLNFPIPDDIAQSLRKEEEWRCKVMMPGAR